MGKHLTFEQRSQLAALQRAGLTQAAIAAQIGSSQSAISRELARNGRTDGYRGKPAHEQAVVRRSTASSLPRKLTPPLIAIIEAQLRREEWSPQQISCWLALTQQTRVSHETIYRHIWADKHMGLCGSISTGD